jgi:DNA end-binding protein Ku
MFALRVVVVAGMRRMGRSRYMARAVWSGSISFGLVNIPVKAFTAVRDHTIHFHQLDKKSGSRVRYKKVSDKTGRELESDDIESAYEVTQGTYVPVDTEELNELRPRTTKTIEVDDFVELGDIDPIFYDKTYWLGPDGEAADRAYQLLHAAMTEAGKAGIGKVVMRTKQYLAAIRPIGDALAMSTMRFADEVVPSDKVVDLPGKAEKPSAKERGLATKIIDSLSTDWKPERYHDTYTEQLEQLIKAKAKGKELVVEDDAEPAGGDVLDLMAALEASLAASKSAKKAPAKKTAAKKAAAKKSTSRKAS